MTGEVPLQITNLAEPVGTISNRVIVPMFSRDPNQLEATFIQHINGFSNVRIRHPYSHLPKITITQHP